MRARRIHQVARNECSFVFRCVNFYLLVAIVTSVPVVLCLADVNVLSRGRGDGQLWQNSQFAIGYQLAMLGGFTYLLGFLDLVGKIWLRDEEDRMTELLLATPLSSGEYVIGKFLGALAAGGTAMGIHLTTLWSLQLLPHAREGSWGPFHPGHALVPAVLILVPAAIWACATLLWLAIRLGSMAGVQLAGFLIFTVTVFVATFDRDGLPGSVRTVFCLLDFTGLRWMNQSFVDMDRGVAFYNESAIGWDLLFLGNRLVLLVLAAAMLWLAALDFDRRRRSSARAAVPPIEPDEAIPSPATGATLRRLARQPRSTLSSFFAVYNYELKGMFENRLFLVMLVIYTLGALLPLFFVKGAFGEPLRLTTGNVVGGWFTILTLYGVITVSFTLIETWFADERHLFSGILFSAPVPSAALVLAKVASCLTFSGALIAMVWLGSVAVQASSGQARIELLPYGVALALIVPTLTFIAALVTFLCSAVGSRQWAYALLMAYFVGLGYLQLTGTMTWAGNVMMIGAWRWSDMSGLEAWEDPLLLNRLLYASFSLPLLYAAVLVHPRCQRDSWQASWSSRLWSRQRQAIRCGVLMLPPVMIGMALVHRMSLGPDGTQARRWQEEYYLKNAETWRDAPVPTVVHVDTDLDIRPSTRGFTNRWEATLENRTGHPLHRFPVTMGRWMTPVRWQVDGVDIKPRDESGLHHVALLRPLGPGARCRLAVDYEAGLHRHPARTPTLGIVPRFVLHGGTYLNTGNTIDVFPIIGFLPLLEGLEPRHHHDDYWNGTNRSSYIPEPFTARVAIRVPPGYTVVAPGQRTFSEEDAGGLRVVHETRHPVKGLPILVARYATKSHRGNEVYHHPGHDYNVPRLLRDLARSRELYSEWFGAYPHATLRMAEFPGVAPFAESFSTVIGYSENMGFLAMDSDLDLLSMITAHETAHQWWGMLVTPADGPSLPILTESLAHYCALAYFAEVLGEKARVRLSRYLEDRYLKGRSVTREKALSEQTMGADRHLAVVRYDKGGFAFWMLSDAMGHAEFRRTLGDFAGRYRDSMDHPTLHDLFEMVKERTQESRRDHVGLIIGQMFEDVVLPSYRIEDVTARREGRRYVTSVRITNVGRGTFPVEVRLVPRGSPPAGETLRARRRHRVSIPDFETHTVEIRSPFEPMTVILDPDALVLQANRQEEGPAIQLSPGEAR